jgi:hypothetical protein
MDSEKTINSLTFKIQLRELGGNCWGNNHFRSHVLKSRRFNPPVQPSWVTSVRTSRRLVTTLHEEITSVPEHLELWHISVPKHLGPKDSTGHIIFWDFLVWMEWTSLEIFPPRRIGQGTIHRLRDISSDSTSKCLTMIRALRPRFGGLYPNLWLCKIADKTLILRIFGLTLIQSLMG